MGVLAGGDQATVGFYDRLADDYHLVYGDRWDQAVDDQGPALAALIAELAPGARTVLDCSCGIGTQAIGLARHGYAVTGTDVSERALTRARREAKRLLAAAGAQIRFATADFRDLSEVGGGFDVVLSADNAVPHMDSDAQVERAFAGMTAALAPGGLLVVSTRDYDAALRSHPPAPPPLQIAGPPRRVVVRLQDWDGPASRWHTTRFLVLGEDEDGDRDGSGWSVAEHAVRYRAVTADELARAAARAGLVAVAWHAAESVGAGYHQPVMTARRPA